MASERLRFAQPAGLATCEKTGNPCEGSINAKRESILIEEISGPTHARARNCTCRHGNIYRDTSSVRRSSRQPIPRRGSGQRGEKKNEGATAGTTLLKAAQTPDGWSRRYSPIFYRGNVNLRYQQPLFSSRRGRIFRRVNVVNRAVTGTRATSLRNILDDRLSRPRERAQGVSHPSPGTAGKVRASAVRG